MTVLRVAPTRGMGHKGAGFVWLDSFGGRTSVAKPVFWPQI